MCSIKKKKNYQPNKITTPSLLKQKSCPIKKQKAKKQKIKIKIKIKTEPCPVNKKIKNKKKEKKEKKQTAIIPYTRPFRKEEGKKGHSISIGGAKNLAIWHHKKLLYLFYYLTLQNT